MLLVKNNRSWSSYLKLKQKQKNIAKSILDSNENTKKIFGEEKK